MSQLISRRDMLKSVAATGAAAPVLLDPLPAVAAPPGGIWITGRLTGAEALVDTLLAEGTKVIFGIPGAQENELWDTFKSRGLPYLQVTHEFSASMMADGYARATGCPGVICLVPGPGVTNALTGIGEALLDSIPMVCIVGDIARGPRYHPFQVHSLDNAELLRPVTKAVLNVQGVNDIPRVVRHAFQLACCGEPGPVAVIIPYNQLMEAHNYQVPPLPPVVPPFDDKAFSKALAVLSDPKVRVGIYAGLGCMNYTGLLVQVAEMLQAPVATSVCGKGTIPENHPLAVGWGYGPQGTRTAETIFQEVDVVLAIGVRYSEVSTAFYSIPRKPVIQVDINPHNLGKVADTRVCVVADAGMFLEQLLARGECLHRPPNGPMLGKIGALKRDEEKKHWEEVYATCGADPMTFVMTLRKLTSPDALVYVDVTITEHLAAEAFTVLQPRTYFNPTDNQAMGWSIPAAIGGQRAFPGRQTVTITGDGCFLFSAMEITTAVRECLPVKFFVLDDQAYFYMQRLQQMAYLRTTATVLARLDYAALAQGFGIQYNEILANGDLEAGIHNALGQPGPVLTRVVTDYGRRRFRWVQAASMRFMREMDIGQQARFARRLGTRALLGRPQND